SLEWAPCIRPFLLELDRNAPFMLLTRPRSVTSVRAATIKTKCGTAGFNKNNKRTRSGRRNLSFTCSNDPPEDRRCLSSLVNRRFCPGGAPHNAESCHKQQEDKPCTSKYPSSSMASLSEVNPAVAFPT